MFILSHFFNLKLKNNIRLLITCDSGAGAGKTTASKYLSKKYGLNLLTSGLLYRFVAARLLAGKKTINDNILNIVRNYLKQSGYEYITFSNLKTSNVEINSIKYEFKLKNKKKMNISKYIGCISAIFNIIEGKAAKTTDVIELVYKRVNVFQVMDSINSFITLRDRKGDSDDDMINLLIENFPKEIPTRDKAVNIIGDWYQEMQMKIDIYGDKKRIVESNPGFETKLKSVIYNDGQYLVITMDNINNIQLNHNF